MSRNKRSPEKIKRCLLLSMCVLLIFFSMAMDVFAEGSAADEEGILDPIAQEGAYSAVLYDNTNGLPTSEANAIAKTDEGFIWVGGYSGLIRYDGKTFERIDPSTGISSVTNLFVDSMNRLWVGMNESGLAMIDNGEITIWNEGNGLGSGKVNVIEEDDSGNIFAGTAGGISVISPALGIQRLTDPRIADVYMEQMSMGSDGLMYCLTNEDDLFTLEKGELKDYISHDDSSIQGITSLLADPDDPGKLYFGTEDSEVYHGSLAQESETMEMVDIDPLFNVINLSRIGDKLWIMTNNGIGVIDDGGFHDLSDLPMNNSVGNVMADYEGNLWFTSTRQGLMKLVKNRFQDVNGYFGLDEAVVNSTCALDDKLFIATDTGLIVLDENGPLETLPITEAVTASGKSLDSYDLIGLLDGNRIRSIIRDSKDRLWISTWRGLGLLRYDHGEVTAFTEDEGLLSDHIRAIYEADDGRIFVAHTGGAAIIEGDMVTSAYGKDSGIVNPEILTVSQAPNGDILAGSNGAGIYVLGPQGTRTIGKESGLTSGIIMRITRDKKRGIYWLVTSNSIAYMTEDYKVTTIENFPYSNNFDMYENGKGEMWVLSSDGIYVVPVEDLLANGEITAGHYGLTNGLPCTSTSNSYSELTPDGYLYISGYTGVVRVNVNEPMEDIGELNLAVPFVEADGRLIYPDENGKFTIPFSTLKLTVHAYVYNYSLTDPLVSYRLEGLDPENITVKRSELGPITYTNLVGKTYYFDLMIKGDQGTTAKGIVVEIVKEKGFYEKPWFIVSMGLILISGIALLIRNYVQWRIADIEEKHREKMERQRIGSELAMANQIQLGMLPHEFPPFPDRKEFDIYASADPAREVGGDFYDYYFIDDDHIAIVMADVSGKGIPAALFMMISKMLLKSFANLKDTVPGILEKANESICSDNRMDMFVTVWMGILELSTGKMAAANAGHEYPAIKRSGKDFEILKDKHGFVIGGMEGVTYKGYEIILEPGDKLFLYTDGVPEATDEDNRMFGNDRMLEALNADSEAPAKEILGNVRKALNDFVKDAEQFDDVTMLCLDYYGPVKTAENA